MTTPLSVPVSDIARRKALVAAIRDRARTLFDSGAHGVQIATAICEATEHLLLNLVEDTRRQFTPEVAARLPELGAIIAVGGTGRGELAPFSDVDLLFLRERNNAGEAGDEFTEFVNRLVQACWDSGLQLGHASRDINTTVTLARQDPQIATALVEARRLWGSATACEQLSSRFWKRIVVPRRRQFIDDCLTARNGGETPPAQELEPDIKSSAGGLRDLHLIRWIGFARYGVKDIDSLRLRGALNMVDARKLKDAWEFLTRLRIDLHLAAGRAQDRLTRDEQLRIARDRGFESTEHQRAVERFMQEYFQHSSELAGISRRFAAIERPRSIAVQVRDLMIGHHAEGVLYVGQDQIDVADRNLPKVCDSVESMLRAYKSAALYDLPLAPRVTEAVKEAVPSVEPTVSETSARLFLDILRCTRSLGSIMRSMFETRLLDLVIPDVSHVRNLLQFNQYHHFTVDEHTLRAIETVTGFEHEDGPVGAAYRLIQKKELLHLALLLHDLGKGFKEDHCIVGERIALRIGARLHLPEAQTDQLALLIRKHLDMADLAFRRDITDPDLLLGFSREMGSPDTLRMLYVLTAADVTSVGPGTWTNWKAGLLAELFDRCLVMLSGKRYSFHEEARIREAKRLVLEHLQRRAGVDITPDDLDQQLRGFSSYYLTTTPPARIADDLLIIHRLTPEDIEVVTGWAPDTGASEYRIITRSPLATVGCFHKMCGVLAAKRLQILSADINTTSEGVVVDSYTVVDSDYDGPPPPERHAEVAAALRDVLHGKATVESLFVRHRRFGSDRQAAPVSNLPTRVMIDNDSSDGRTIIDVFAHDRPGLLYTVSRALLELNLSIDMAKIATHFDQVVDVFYVQEADGRKVQGSDRLRTIKDRLQSVLQEFEAHAHRQFTGRT